ncbi:MAG TPA: hypothetical protein VLJ21_00945 [Candidatus Binatia bacterium]|nr:hypothetical protein [Candidatus Binatia bacterium]
MLNKRGVSPLIATLILIGFSVGLGAIVMSFGEAYVEEQATFVSSPEVGGSCTAVDLQLITVKGVPQICVRDRVVELSLDNGPGTPIAALQARVVGTDNLYLAPNVLKSPLLPASSLKTAFTLDPIGTPVQVKLTPVLHTVNGQVFCPDQAITVEDLRAC